MKRIKIVTDSTSDIPKVIADKHDISILPLTILLEEKEYRDWIDIKPSEFYSLMRKSVKLPTTSMVNPVQFSQAYERILTEYDEIISIHLSSHGSGTYNSAAMAKETVDKDRITVIDTWNYTYGYGQFVVEAAIMAEEGKSRDEIVERMNYMKENLKTLFVVDTLEYLKKRRQVICHEGDYRNSFKLETHTDC